MFNSLQSNLNIVALSSNLTSQSMGMRSRIRKPDNVSVWLIEQEYTVMK